MYVLFIFYVNGILHSASEGVDNAVCEEAYLNSRHSSGVEMRSVASTSYDECWVVSNHLPLYGMPLEEFPTVH